MAKSTPTNKNESLDLSDLNGEISSPLISDSHFGISEDVWRGAQRVADLLPFPVTVFGDIDEAIVGEAIESSKGLKLQADLWKEYASTITASLKDFARIKESQAKVTENVAEARLQHAELEKELGKNVASLESKYRQTLAHSRTATAGVQSELSISLSKIATQYSQNVAKRQELAATESQPKQETDFQKQGLTIAESFRQKRQARYNGAMAGLSQRVKSS